jgi:hypothetical protein
MANAHSGNAKTEQTYLRHDATRYRRRDSATADAPAYWFAGVAVFAFLAAGIIVYRVAASDLRLAPSDTSTMSVAATSSPIEQPPIHAHVEGIDP